MLIFVTLFLLIFIIKLNDYTIIKSLTLLIKIYINIKTHLFEVGG